MPKRRLAIEPPRSRARNAYDLLTAIRHVILREPRRYNQGNWLERTPKGKKLASYEPSCGTVGCIAGWAIVLTRKRGEDGSFDSFNVARLAQKLLGLSPSQADRLFNGGAASGNPQTKDHAIEGVKHIAEFQQDFSSQLKKKRV